MHAHVMQVKERRLPQSISWCDRPARTLCLLMTCCTMQAFRLFSLCERYLKGLHATRSGKTFRGPTQLRSLPGVHKWLVRPV